CVKAVEHLRSAHRTASAQIADAVVEYDQPRRSSAVEMQRYIDEKITTRVGVDSRLVPICVFRDGSSGNRRIGESLGTRMVRCIARMIQGRHDVRVGTAIDSGWRRPIEAECNISLDVHRHDLVLSACWSLDPNVLGAFSKFTV